MHTYGPAVPADDAQTSRLLTALHVAVPRAHDWTDNQKAIYFRNFLFALWPPPSPGERGPRATAGHGAEDANRDAARDQARHQLVARLDELPTDPSLAP